MPRGQDLSPIDKVLAEAESPTRGTPNSLAEIESLFGDRSALLAHLAERSNQEQSWFWSRFSAFATLHAGLFVLITSDAIAREHRYRFAIAGFALAACWAIIQAKSLSYVRSSKKPYHTYRVVLGLNTREHNVESTRRFTASSTFWGVLTAFVVLITWIVAAVVLFPL